MKINRSEEFFKLLSITFVIIILILGISLFFLSNLKDLNNEKMNNNNNPIVVFETNSGTFKAEIFKEESPITANNFLKLVEDEFYNGLKFHRIMENFMIQTGDPLSAFDEKKSMWGTGGPGYNIQDEFIDNLSNVKGTLSMANSGPNSGGSQFFINVVDNTYLDFDKQPFQSKHPVFGKVIEGMDVVIEISKVKTNQNDAPIKNVVLEKVYILN